MREWPLPATSCRFTVEGASPKIPACPVGGPCAKSPGGVSGFFFGMHITETRKRGNKKSDQQTSAMRQGLAELAAEQIRECAEVSGPPISVAIVDVARGVSGEIQREQLPSSSYR